MNITIRGKPVDVDIKTELERFDWGYRAVWRSDKIIASSPFREDNAPSFYVKLEGDFAGVWGDSGAIDEEYKSGGFVKLLALLDNATYEDTEEYLLEQYGEVDSSAPIRIQTPKIRTIELYKELAESTVTQATSPYLLRRGIIEKTQRLHGVGYTVDKRGYTAIPWRTPNGKLATVMYRATTGKRFTYIRGGTPRSRLVYGIDVINAQGITEAVLCEAPIDALSWWSVGVPAIAVGGSTLSDEQLDIIRRSPLKSVVLGGDNDGAGALFNRKAADRLRVCVRLAEVSYGTCKDANAVLTVKGVQELRGLRITRIGQVRLCKAVQT